MSVTTYIVKPGDTLPGLAERFGVSVEALAAANHLVRPGELVAGLPLVVPLVPGDLAAAAFPAEGWVPGVARLTPSVSEGEDEPSWLEEGGPPRAVSADRMWLFRLPFPAVTTALFDQVLLVLHAFPQRPRPGQRVILRLVTLNVGPTPVLLRHPTTQLAEFVATLGGREVFRASEGRVYAQVVREVVLGPGQTEAVVERFVPQVPGEYEITAWNTAFPRARLRLRLPVE